MNDNEVNLDKIFSEVCDELGIEISNSRYYVNESTYYEFNNEYDLFRVVSEFNKKLSDKKSPFKIAIRYDPEGALYSIEIFLEL